MTTKEVAARERAESFMAALASRNWRALATTLREDVRRIGVEGADVDGVVGRAPYMQWLAGFADPLYEYTWIVHRIVCSGDGLVAMIDATTRYRLTKYADPFGYRLVMILDFDEQGLIRSNDLYWKTPSQRVPGDTTGAKA